MGCLFPNPIYFTWQSSVFEGLGSEVTYLQNIQGESICPTSSTAQMQSQGQMCLFKVRLLGWTAEPG